MNMKIELPVPIGAPFEDGRLAGGIRVGADCYAIVLPPKAVREHAPTVWNDSYQSVDGALSYYDGVANTIAMADAGSPLAQWALDLRMHIPAQDELEQIYRHFKPSTDKNWCFARSGINLSAIVPTYPYTPDFPRQTTFEEFRTGGAEAFAEAYYWTSTQRPEHSSYAFVQTFGSGDQDWCHEGSKFHGCAVRRIKL